MECVTPTTPVDGSKGNKRWTLLVDLGIKCIPSQTVAAGVLVTPRCLPSLDVFDYFEIGGQDDPFHI